ncbi:MAG: MerR family transcriptional regulator [Ornithinimicrobium sp.]|uniref:MerR family transcriptional regulator n=1 Tax=Ornithinimicrobium sp. TaxID=1977084 RepID=UPI003D9BD588
MIETEQETQVLTVGQVAAELGVTVRTLHHYDEIGLLVPVERSYAGYRLYTEADLERLQHIVVYRRLGFALDEVATLLQQPDDVVTHLRRQRDSVMARMDQLGELVASIDTALEAQMTGYQITKDEQRELFGDAFDDDYAAEAEQRWGETDAWAQSQQRTQRYSKEQWQQIKAETDMLSSRFIDLMQTGTAPEGTQAMRVAEDHRQHICRWFYDCSPQMHAGIAELYVTDDRFAKSFEDQAAGLARYAHDAVVANAARLED